jgi:hypothetical protein
MAVDAQETKAMVGAACRGEASQEQWALAAHDVRKAIGGERALDRALHGADHARQCAGSDDPGDRIAVRGGGIERDIAVINDVSVLAQTADQSRGP